jgi:hypothetical protein
MLDTVNQQSLRKCALLMSLEKLKGVLCEELYFKAHFRINSRAASFKFSKIKLKSFLDI